MKRKMWLVGFMAAALVGAVWTAYADDDKPAADDNGKMSMDDNGGGPGGMQGGMMGGHFDWMKKKLGLSDSQETKLKDLFKKQMEEGKPLRDQLKIDMDTLQQKVDTKASNDEVKKVLDALSADRKGMEASRQKMEDAVREILDPTQQAKFVLSMKDRGRGMMGKWKGKWHHDGKDGDKKGSPSGDDGSGNKDSNDNGGAKDN
jgi:Spy/CpxP family protein refolding chaperone